MKTKSPLKAKPLSTPGQSTHKAMWDVLMDEFVLYYFIAMLLTLFAGMEWWSWYSHRSPNPIFFSLIAAISLLIAFWKCPRALKKARRMALGRDGEIAVGQFLDSLRAEGAEVFHDIPGDNFNVDHVIIHPTGVYAVETKTWSKPEKGESRLVFNGETITRFGKTADRNPVIQAKAAGNWLSQLIQDSTGRKLTVRSVVVFPGWFIESTAEARFSDVWVLNPRALPTFIKNSTQQLNAEDVKLVSYHLSRYIRAENAKRIK